MSYYPSAQSFLSTVLVLSCIAFAIFVVLRGKTDANRRAIERWFENMDIGALDQRYRGSRSTELFEFLGERDGLVGYRTKKLYRTISGRYFEMEILSELCQVVHWQLTPVTQEDGDAFAQLLNANAAA